jgi:5-methylcytosine-specific restriction endonuclease McrA
VVLTDFIFFDNAREISQYAANQNAKNTLLYFIQPNLLRDEYITGRCAVLLDLSNVKDMDLVARTKSLRNAEHECLIDILQHLIETENRRLDLDLGYSSLFDYCVNYLEYSESAAGRRIQAARCSRRYPIVLEMLAKNELNLTIISQIERELTDENYTSILERVKGRSYREVEKVACELRPPLKFKDRVRPVCVAVKATPASNEDARGAACIVKKMLVQFLADETLVDKLEEVKALLSAGNPNASFADIVEVLVNEYLERHSPVARQERREKKARSAEHGDAGTRACAPPAGGDARKGVNGPDSRRRECEDPSTSHQAPMAARELGSHTPKAQATSRHVPKALRDYIFARDGACCSFRSADGTRCTATHGLQIDHIKPFANGGESDLRNLRLLCAAHNRRAAEKTMGAHVMQSYWRRA